MDRVIELITENLDVYPEFNEHILAAEKAEEYMVKHPAISIDASKCLIEGICKTIVKHLTNDQSEKRIDKTKIESIFNLAIELLSESNVNVDFPEKVYTATNELNTAIGNLNKIVKEIANIRNESGELSHGHLAPKLAPVFTSNARMIMGFSAGVTAYLLESFYNISPDASILPYKYEDYGVLNAALDMGNMNIRINDITYSKLLYQHDYNQYITLCDEFDAMERGEQETMETPSEMDDY